LPSTDRSPSLFPLWFRSSFPSSKPHPAIVASRIAEVDDAITVDARTPEENARAPAPACNSCAHSGHRGSSRRHFPTSPSPDDLGEPLPCETLAGVVPHACMQRPVGTMVIRHRPSSNRTAGKPPYRFGWRRAGRRVSRADPAQIWRGLARSSLFTLFS
jgi:hypothetical protein